MPGADDSEYKHPGIWFLRTNQIGGVMPEQFLPRAPTSPGLCSLTDNCDESDNDNPLFEDGEWWW